MSAFSTMNECLLTMAMLQENAENEGISPLKSDTVGVHYPHGRIIKKVITDCLLSSSLSHFIEFIDYDISLSLLKSDRVESTSFTTASLRRSLWALYLFFSRLAFLHISNSKNEESLKSKLDWDPACRPGWPILIPSHNEPLVCFRQSGRPRRIHSARRTDSSPPTASTISTGILIDRISIQWKLNMRLD